MNSTRTSAIAAALLACVLPFSGGAIAAPSNASELLGTTVVDARGKRIGALTDLVVDLDKGQIVGVQVGHSTADGMANEVFALPGVQMSDGRLVVRVGHAPMAGEAPAAQSLAKMLHAPLRDAQGKPAGEIADLLVSFDDARVTAFVIHFDPKWLDMAAPAAVPLSSVERKDDGFVAKFSSDHVRPAGPSAPKVAAPPPPPPVLRARLARLLGSTIVDASGKAAAIIDDASIDTNGRRLVALVIHAEGGQPTSVTFPQPGLRFENGKLTATGAVDALAKSSAANLTPGRRMLETRIANPAGEPAGKVEDVVIDMADGRLAFAVASFDPSWVAAGWIAAVPVRAIMPDKNGAPAMKFSLNDINYSFLFQASNWPDFSDPAVRAAIDAKIGHM